MRSRTPVDEPRREHDAQQLAQAAQQPARVAGDGLLVAQSPADALAQQDGLARRRGPVTSIRSST